MNTASLNGLELRWGLADRAARSGAQAMWEGAATSGRLCRNEVFRSYIEGFTFEPPDSKPWALSLAVVALEAKPRSLRFEFKGDHVTLPLPSCYAGSPVSRDDVRQFLALSLGGGVRCEAAETIPLKLAAAWTGLARYGRNGLCHVPGIGSSVRLMAFWTDVPCEATSVRDSAAGPGGAAFLDRCSSCSACVRACPTGAIPGDFGFVDATRCLSLYNEIEGVLPGWIPGKAHNAAVGCLACQRCCPEAGRILADESGTESLSEDELELILAGRDEPGTNAAVARVTRRSESDSVDSIRPVLARNLRAFLTGRRVA